MSSPIITVDTPAESFDLTVLEKLKLDLDLLDDSEDKQLARFITSASRLVATFIGRTLAKQTYTERTQGYGTLELMLTHTPILSLSSVYINGELVIDAEISNPDSGLLYRENGWRWNTDNYSGLSMQPMPGREHPKIKVTYEAGYVLPSFQEDEDTLPPDIEEACVIAAKDLYLAKETYTGISQEKVGDISVSYSQKRGGLSELAKDILEPYRRIV